MYLPTTLLTLLTSFFNPFPQQQQQKQELKFTLRQYHAVTPDARILFHDALSPSPSLSHTTSDSESEPAYEVRTRRVRVHRPRPRSIRTEDGNGDGGGGGWEEDEVDAPDTESRETLLLLAKMTNNAYLEPGEAEWYDLPGEWNVVSAFALRFDIVGLDLSRNPVSGVGYGRVWTWTPRPTFRFYRRV